jgi:hypothetical protein
MKRLLAFSFLMSFSIAACSSGSGRGNLEPDGGLGGNSFGGSSSGGSGGSTTGAGSIALSVPSASAPSQVASSSPSAGNTFAELDVTLQNKSSSTPVSMNFALFTLGTDQSLVLNSSGLSGSVTPECSPSTSVATGGSFSCKLVFEVPTGQKATTIYYDDKQGHQASAPVPAIAAPPPSTCEQSATVLTAAFANPSGPCGQCVFDGLQPGSASCGAESTAATNACSGQNCFNNCVGSSGGTPAAFCSCYQSCADAACWAAAQTDLACIAKACASSC